MTWNVPADSLPGAARPFFTYPLIDVYICIRHPDPAEEKTDFKLQKKPSRRRLFVEREPSLFSLLLCPLYIYFSPYIYPSIYLSGFRLPIIFTPTRTSFPLSLIFLLFTCTISQFRSLPSILVFTRLSLPNGCMNIASTRFSRIR